MTREEFKNLKVGDIIKEYKQNGKYYIHKIITQLKENPFHNYRFFNTVIIETNHSVYENKFSEAYSFAYYTYYFINKKPKKLYKPWG